MKWELITNITLLLSFATLAIFIILALVQLFSRKTLKKVDRPLLLMPIPLVLMAVTYFIFDKLIILNTRPNGSGEPSFPSTHTMVVATIFSLVAIILPNYIKSKALLIVLYILMLALIIITSIGRVLANMHWTSDVIAALVFAAIFAAIYFFLLKKSSKASTSK